MVQTRSLGYPVAAGVSLLVRSIRGVIAQQMFLDECRAPMARREIETMANMADAVVTLHHARIRVLGVARAAGGVLGALGEENWV